MYTEDPQWADCQSSAGTFEALFRARLSFAKLEALSRIYTDPDLFVKAVLAVAEEEGLEEGRVKRLDLLMIHLHVRPEPVVPVPPVAPLPLGGGPPVAPLGAPPPFRRAEVGERALVAAGLGAPALVPAPGRPRTAEERETDEGKLPLIRDANLLGVSALSVLRSHVSDGGENEDAVAEANALIRKAIAKGAANGGAVLKAVRGGEETFTTHIEELCQFLSDLEEPLMMAVARIRVCVTQAPAWKAGAKQYWISYFTKHGFKFPVRFDQLLQHQAQNAAIKHLVLKLGDTAKIDRAAAQMDGISAQLAACYTIGESSDGGALADGTISFRNKCNRCLENGHAVKDCPHSAEMATKLRAAFVNGRSCERRKATVPDPFDSGADSN